MITIYSAFGAGAVGWGRTNWGWLVQRGLVVVVRVWGNGMHLHLRQRHHQVVEKLD